MKDKLRIEGVNSQGFGIIPKMVMRDREISCGAKALYAYICSYAGNGETAWPGRELIIKDLNISKNTYNSYLNELKTRDYIRTQQERSKTGVFMHNIFILVSSPQPGTKIWSTDEPGTKKREPEKREPKICDSNINNSLIKTDLENKQQQGSPEGKENCREKDVVVFSDLQKMLKSIGFSNKRAVQIIKMYDAEKIIMYVEYVSGKNEIPNKPGWVTEALKENWTISEEQKQTDHLREKTVKLQNDFRQAQKNAAEQEIMEKYLGEIKNFFRFPGNGNIKTSNA